MQMEFMDILQPKKGNGGRSNPCIPWTADLEYWIAGREEDGTADPAWRTEEGYLELCDGLGVFPYYWYQNFWCGRPVYDETVRVETDISERRAAKAWITPRGTISEVVEYLPGSCSWAHTKHSLVSEEDLAVFEYIIEHRTMVPNALDDYPERLTRWKRHGGLPSIALPRGPLSAFFYEWAGVVNGVYLIMDYPERIDYIFTMMQEQEKPLLRALAEVKPPLVHFADNVSADNMTGYFDRYMRNVYESRLDVLHGAGIACAVHLDGVVRGIIDKLAGVGIDVIEALTPSPGGDLEVEDIRKAANSDSVILWGGVPGILFSPPHTWDDVRKHVERTVEAWKGTPFILGVADQVPADGNIEIVRNISDYVGELQAR